MDQRIYSLPDAPLPLDADSYYEVLVPDVSSDTGYTSCKIKPSSVGGDMLSIKVNLTAAQIKTLFSVPVELIPTPGAGKVIEVVSAFGKLNYNSVAFDGGSSLLLKIDTANQPQFDDMGSALHTSTANSILKFEIYASVSANDKQLVSDKALMAAFDNADSVNGNSTMDLYITYKIVTL